MALGWIVNVAAANTYFSTERLETSAWDALTEVSANLQRTKVLMMAYNRLYYCGLFELPTYDEASAAQLVILCKAQAETAYYLAQHLADEDRRTGLQAQGVETAGIVKETYQSSGFAQLPIPPIVYGLLAEFIVDADASPFYATSVDRDEDDDDMEL
jgi:hypothetical protein